MKEGVSLMGFLIDTARLGIETVAKVSRQQEDSKDSRIGELKWERNQHAEYIRWSCSSVVRGTNKVPTLSSRDPDKSSFIRPLIRMGHDISASPTNHKPQ